MQIFFAAVLLFATMSIAAQAAPVVTILWPLSNSTTSNSSIAVSGNVSSSTSTISSVKVNNVQATLNSQDVVSTTWTATVPLGYGTNALTVTATDATGDYTTTTTTPVLVTCTSNLTYSLTANSSATGVITTNASNGAATYNPLIIPDTISGTTMNLTLAVSSKRFFSAASNATTTLGYNEMPFWGPTLIMYKGDKMQMNVKNNLSADTTTCHWHGLHLPAIMDGGPHIPFSANTTWTPSFTITNDASTCWYHPHYHGSTATQVAAGAGGLIIVRDGTEATKGLPWTYGVDDIPLAISSRTFNATTGQMMLVSGNEPLAYAVGNTMLVNGVVKPQVTLPRQIVRLRILNAELQRGLNLGLSNNSTFYVIGNDVGLLNAPAAVTRLQLTPGERVEILLDLQNATVNSTIDLMAYNKTTANASAPILPTTFIATGAKGSSPTTTTLTTSNFPILNMKIGNQTTIPICTPVTGNFSANGTLTLSGASSAFVLANHTFFTANNVTSNRTVTLTSSGGFGFDGNAYDEFYYNYAIPLNSIEKWTITNNSGVSHPIHLHETKFNIVARKNATGTANGTAVTTNGLPAAWETGWKDTVYVPSGEQVQIIVKFDQYASNTDPYMFHCHMLTHEEGGFMGQFLVVNNETENLTIASFTSNATSSAKEIEFDSTTNTTYKIQYRADLADSWLDIGTITSVSGDLTTIYTDSDAVRCAKEKGFYRVVLPSIDTYPLISR